MASFPEIFADHHTRQLLFVCVVKSEFLHKKLPVVKNTICGKSAESSALCSLILCEPKMNIHRAAVLWKTPVEKPVENVENSELSTGILMVSETVAGCGIFVYRFA